MMTRASPNASAAWIVWPSGPGRRTTASAFRTLWQNAISASGSRHTSIGITLGDVSGIGFTAIEGSPHLMLKNLSFTRTPSPAPICPFHYRFVAIDARGARRGRAQILGGPTFALDQRHSVYEPLQGCVFGNFL